MDVEAVETFTSVLAIGAGALAVLVVAGRLLRRYVGWIDEAMIAIDDAAMWIAWIIAAVATAGSLYYSEVANFYPCRMCWFQRIAMYPLAAILLVGAIRRDRNARWYVLPIAAVGVGLSTYHYTIEWRPSLEGGACGIGVESCTYIWFREFGFVTLALMALCGFAAIIALLSGRELGDGSERPGAERLEPHRRAEDDVPA